MFLNKIILNKVCSRLLYSRQWCRDQDCYKDMGTELARMKSIRTAYKGHCTRNFTAANDMMTEASPNIDELENLLENLTLRMEKIAVLDKQILEALEPDAIDEEVQSSIDYEENWVKVKKKLTNFILRAKTPTLSETPSAVVTSLPSSVATSQRRQFEKLQRTISKDFSGNPLEWKSF